MLGLLLDGPGWPPRTPDPFRPKNHVPQTPQDQNLVPQTPSGVRNSKNALKQVFLRAYGRFFDVPIGLLLLNKGLGVLGLLLDGPGGCRLVPQAPSGPNLRTPSPLRPKNLVPQTPQA